MSIIRCHEVSLCFTGCASAGLHIPSRSGATRARETGETGRRAGQRQRRCGGHCVLLCCGGGGDERSALGRRLDCGGLYDAVGGAGGATGGVSCPGMEVMTLLRSCVSGGVGGYGDGVGEREGKWGAGGNNGQELELGEGENSEKGEDIHCAFGVGDSPCV